MSFIWCVVLVIYGLNHAWDIPTLHWLLLFPMAMQDLYDITHKRQS